MSGFTPFLDPNILDRKFDDTVIRVAKIISINQNDGVCQIQYLDGMGTNQYVPVSMPMIGGDGWGIFAMPTPGSLVAIAYRPERQPVIVGYPALDYQGYLSRNSDPSTFMSKSSASTGIQLGSPIPAVAPGEIALHSKGGADVYLTADGSVLIASQKPQTRVLLDNKELAHKVYALSSIGLYDVGSGLITTQAGTLRSMPLTLNAMSQRATDLSTADVIKQAMVYEDNALPSLGWNTTVTDANSNLVGAISIEAPVVPGIMQSGLLSGFSVKPNYVGIRAATAISSYPTTTIRTPSGIIEIYADGSIIISSEATIGITSKTLDQIHTDMNIKALNKITVAAKTVSITGNIDITGNVKITGDLDIVGAASVSKQISTPQITDVKNSGIVFSASSITMPRLKIDNDLIAGATTITGRTNITGRLDVTGNFVLTGALQATGFGKFGSFVMDTNILVARVGDPVVAAGNAGIITGRSS